VRCERELKRDEIPLVWTIDRREQIERIYYCENGALVLKPERYDMQGWPAGEEELYSPILHECYDRGGWFYGIFSDGQLIAVTVLDGKFIGPAKRHLQLEFLHVSFAHRGKGLGKYLLSLSAEEARMRGAQALYISATPSEHTVNFYLQQGCRLIAAPDPVLFAREPGDIHFEYVLQM
jgi:predicted N-acetyltransferase YhbS